MNVKVFALMLGVNKSVNPLNFTFDKICKKYLLDCQAFAQQDNKKFW